MRLFGFCFGFLVLYGGFRFFRGGSCLLFLLLCCIFFGDSFTFRGSFGLFSNDHFLLDPQVRLGLSLHLVVFILFLVFFAFIIFLFAGTLSSGALLFCFSNLHIRIIRSISPFFFTTGALGYFLAFFSFAFSFLLITTSRCCCIFLLAFSSGFSTFFFSLFLSVLG